MAETAQSAPEQQQIPLEAPPGVTVDMLAHAAALRILDDSDKKDGLAPEPEKKEPPEVPVEQKAEEGGTQEGKPPEEEKPEEVEWDKIRNLKRKFTVKAEDGSDQEIELSLEDMQKGIMFERDYRAKTAQLAREREAVQSKVKAETEPVIRQYQENLAVFERALWHTIAPEIQGIDWNSLAKNDPAQWTAKMQQVNNVNAVLQSVKAEQARLASESQKEIQSARAKQASESVEALKRDIPGWNDDLYGKILKAGLDYGYKPEEVNAIVDSRAIKVLHDAMKYRALQAAKPTVEKRVAEVPKVAKPGTSERIDPKAEAKTKAWSRLRQTGRTEDALEVAKSFIE